MSRCKHKGVRFRGGSPVVDTCGDCGKMMKQVDCEPELRRLIERAYERPPSEIAATWIVTAIVARKTP